MRPPSFALVLLVGLSALAACDTGGSGLLDPQEVRLSDLSQDPAALVGTWELATVTPSGECYTENCTRTRSAAEAGWSERIAFRADGVAEVFRDGVTGEAVPYRVDSEATPAHLVLGPRRALFGVAGDQLFLDDRYIDGELLEFRRLVPVSHRSYAVGVPRRRGTRRSAHAPPPDHTASTRRRGMSGRARGASRADIPRPSSRMSHPRSGHPLQRGTSQPTA